MITAIIKNYKNCCDSSNIKDRDLQQGEHLYVWNLFERMHVYSILGLKFIQNSYAIPLKPIRENGYMLNMCEIKNNVPWNILEKVPKVFL